MNTKDNWLITVKISDVERSLLFEKVFPDGVVPIVSPITCRACVPELGEVDVYMLDINALSAETVDLLCVVLSSRFGVPLNEARQEIRRGVPIVAKGVQVVVKDFAWGGPALFDDFGNESDEDD